jgi:hypothetical protein
LDQAVILVIPPVEKKIQLFKNYSHGGSTGGFALAGQVLWYLSYTPSIILIVVLHAREEEREKSKDLCL